MDDEIAGYDARRNAQLWKEQREQDADPVARNQARLDWWMEAKLRRQEEARERARRGIRVDTFGHEIDYHPWLWFMEETRDE